MKSFNFKKVSLLIILTLIILCTNYPSVLASAEGWRFTTNPVYEPVQNPPIARNGYLYALGVTKYQWTVINPNGTLGNWTSVNGSSGGGIRNGLATTANLIYSSGGRISYDVSVPPLNYLWYAGFNPDGSLVNPVSQNSPGMQTARWYHSSLILNGRLYCFGGYSDSAPFSGALSSVEFASINVDSSVGSFQYTSSFSRINGAVFTAFNFGSTVYCVGSNPGQSTTYLERATLNPNGTLSAWSTIAGPFPFAGPATLTSRTTLLLVQYELSTTPQSYNMTYITGFSPINGINNFLSAPHALIPRYNGSITTWGRFVYHMGGQNPNPPYELYNSVELYDPDLADTELFPDMTTIIPSQSIHLLEIPLDLESKNDISR